jgi:hypothetical protein
LRRLTPSRRYEQQHVDDVAGKLGEGVVQASLWTRGRARLGWSQKGKNINRKRWKGRVMASPTANGHDEEHRLGHDLRPTKR